MSTLVTLTRAWATIAQAEYRHRSACQTTACDTCFSLGIWRTMAADRVQQCRRPV
jgi:hypothetical protein